jgi:hypothetical protein
MRPIRNDRGQTIDTCYLGEREKKEEDDSAVIDKLRKRDGEEKLKNFSVPLTLAWAYSFRTPGTHGRVRFVGTVGRRVRAERARGSARTNSNGEGNLMESHHAAGSRRAVALSPMITVGIIVLAAIAVFCFTLFFAARP